jgi:hypothetical protein
MLFELRKYSPPTEHGVPALARWFREYVLPAWDGLDMRALGTWTVAGPDTPHLTTLLAFADPDERETQLGRFYSAEVWSPIGRALYADGTGLIGQIDTCFLAPMAYSPDPLTMSPLSGAEVFEEVVYRGHTPRTLALFSRVFAERALPTLARNGAISVGVWDIAVGAGQPALYTLRRYPSAEAMSSSLRALARDPIWQGIVEQTTREDRLIRKAVREVLVPVR